jgi:hypothetical protein
LGLAPCFANYKAFEDLTFVEVPEAAIKSRTIYALCLNMLKDMAALKLKEDEKVIEPSSALRFAFVKTLLVTIVDC